MKNSKTIKNALSLAAAMFISLPAFGSAASSGARTTKTDIRATKAGLRSKKAEKRVNKAGLRLNEAELRSNTGRRDNPTGNLNHEGRDEKGVAPALQKGILKK